MINQEKKPSSSTESRALGENKEIITPEEKPIEPSLSLEDLKKTLAEADEFIKSSKSLDEMVKKREEILERLERIELIREARVKRFESYSPLANLQPEDYERLVKEKIIDADECNILNQLDQTIKTLESLSDRSSEAEIRLLQLKNYRDSYREKIKNEILRKREELRKRCEDLKNKTIELYRKKEELLKEELEKIESDPRVSEYLREELYQKIFMKNKKEKEKIEQASEKNIEEIIKQAHPFIQSLADRHQVVFERIKEITGDEKIYEKLINALEEKDENKQKNFFKIVRKKLINAIINGQGEKQIKEPKEVVPWRKPSRIRYGEAIRFLESEFFLKALYDLKKRDEKGEKIVEEIEEKVRRIFDENTVLRKLIGREYIEIEFFNKTTKKKERKTIKGEFWAAFDERQKKDEELVIKKYKKEVEELIKRLKNDPDRLRLGLEIKKRGGIEVLAPITKKIKELDKVFILGNLPTVVRLEKKKTEQGTEYWEVVELLDEIHGLEKGQKSLLDMSNFPEWFRGFAKIHFIQDKDGNFIEKENK